MLLDLIIYVVGLNNLCFSFTTRALKTATMIPNLIAGDNGASLIVWLKYPLNTLASNYANTVWLGALEQSILKFFLSTSISKLDCKTL